MSKAVNVHPMSIMMVSGREIVKYSSSMVGGPQRITYTLLVLYVFPTAVTIATMETGRAIAKIHSTVKRRLECRRMKASPVVEKVTANRLKIEHNHHTAVDSVPR